MKLLKRNVRLAELPARFQGFVLTVCNILYYFKRPFEVLWHYVRSTSPPPGYVALRNGYQVFFSGHKHDLITTVVVFCKRDYGRVAPNSIVVDIGANIGVYSLYAAMMGAKKVYAFEPNEEAYACLVKNITVNGVTDVIKPFQLAVTERSGEQVQIPVAASPHNQIRTGTTETQSCTLVETIALGDILEKYIPGEVDLLKMDCEGAEYVIIPGLGNETLSRLAAIRLEYHTGPLSTLISHLKSHDFKVIKQKKEQSQNGILWFAKLGPE